MPKQPPRAARRDARPAADARALGQRAFAAGRYEQAAALWAPLRGDPAVRLALAEAYFRLALAAPAPGARADALRLGVAASPDDPRLHFHLGMALHRQGDLSGAEEHYALAAAARPAPRGLPLLRALLAIEQGRLGDSAVTSLPEAERRAIAGALDLLRGALPPPGHDDPLASFWCGLGLLGKGQPAGEALAAAAAVPPALSPLRRYYSGLAAALAGDAAGALAAWARAPRDRYSTPWRLENEAAALFARISELLAADEPAAAADVAAEVAGAPATSTALSELAVQALDDAARGAARSGEWPQAARWWSAARSILAAAEGLGSPRPLLHNLALAYEAQEQWLEAADAWRAMLRTRPRRSAKPPATGLSDDQWGWVRRRVLTCYQKADQPGLAVEVYRQALKADPEDLDLRLELSSALLANDQMQAAVNELRRILERDPEHVEAQARVAAIYLAENRWWEADAALKRLARQKLEGDGERRLVAGLLAQLGSKYNEFGSYEQAYRAFGDAARFDPAQYVYQINLAQAAFNMRRKKDAAKHVEQALELGAAVPDAYVAAISCWAVEHDLKQARAVLARAEAALEPEPTFFVEAGVELLDGSAPPQASVFNPFGPVSQPEPRDDEWARLATSLFDKALAMRPDDAALRHVIASELLQVEPAIALRYAGEAALLAPDDVRAQMLKGLLQGLVGDKKAAKNTLRQAIKLAKQQGLADLAESAEQLRRQVDSPFFSMALQMGPAFEELDLDDDEIW
jgi:tetratricopeptide (TPR) repeat protein